MHKCERAEKAEAGLAEYREAIKRMEPRLEAALGNLKKIRDRLEYVERECDEARRIGNADALRVKELEAVLDA